MVAAEACSFLWPRFLSFFKLLSESDFFILPHCVLSFMDPIVEVSEISSTRASGALSGLSAFSALSGLSSLGISLLECIGVHSYSIDESKVSSTEGARIEKFF